VAADGTQIIKVPQYRALKSVTNEREISMDVVLDEVRLKVDDAFDTLGAVAKFHGRVIAFRSYQIAHF